MTTPADLDAITARALIGRRALSPVELAEACIARVRALDHAVNALVAYDFDRVLEDARKAEAEVMSGALLGPLHGLPVAVKDMNDVAGLPTTFGSEIYRGNVADRDDALVAALRQAGAIPLGKTNVPEWSAGANTRNRVYGATGNPYDPMRSAAGSSGGSAVALALGYAPLATGSDLGGSLRNPAAFCGVVGLRPGFGTVPGAGRAMGLLPLGTAGPMARTVRDAERLLWVMAAPDLRDPFSVAGPGPEDGPQVADLATLRVAATEDFGFAPTEASVRRQFRKAISALAPAFHRLEEATPDCPGADRTFAVLRAVGFLDRHARLLDSHPAEVGPNVADNVREGRALSAEDVARALVAQTVLQRAWLAFFDRRDLVVSPAVTISPRDWRELYPTQIDGVPTKSYYHWLALAYAVTLSGHPAISIPCGMDEHGMPFGLQIVGRRGGEARLLAAAAAIEAVIGETADLSHRKPDLAGLQAAAPLSERGGPDFLAL